MTESTSTGESGSVEDLGYRDNDNDLVGDGDLDASRVPDASPDEPAVESVQEGAFVESESDPEATGLDPEED